MQCEADRSHHREHQSKSSDDQPGRHESEVVLPETDAEKRHDKASCQCPRADRKAEYTRREPRQHGCIQLLTIGGRSSFGPVSIDDPLEVIPHWRDPAFLGCFLRNAAG